MPIDVTTDKRRLLEIMESAREGHVALPQFQRNFVWPVYKIEDLLTSLLKGYYLGSFLVLDVDKHAQPFAIRPIVGVDIKPEEMEPRWLLLDGQQRLTSLHYALTGPDLPTGNTKHPYRFFIRLDALAADDDEVVFCERADRCGKWDRRETQFRERILPFTEARGWSKWKDDYDDWLADTRQEEIREQYRTEWRKPWTEAIEERLLNRPIPYVELPRVADDDPDGIAEVCTVFEKINSTGEPLSVYDLLTARLYKYGVDLHALWEAAMEGNSRLATYTDGASEKYGQFILKTIALIRRKETKSKALVNLNPAGFEEDWDRAARALEIALKRLTSTSDTGFGVFDTNRWQPYTTLLPVLAAVLDDLKGQKADSRQFADVQAWYWGSVFTERYAGSVDSTMYRDALDLYSRFNDATFEPAAFRDFRREILDNPTYTFSDLARKTSRYRGIMNLIAVEGARDFMNNDGIEFHELEDHHIFPRAFLREKLDLTGGTEVNNVVNRTLIVTSTNRKISRTRPSQYLSELIPEEHRAKIMASHLINAEAQAALAADDYAGFLRARDEALVAKVRSLLAPVRTTEVLA